MMPLILTAPLRVLVIGAGRAGLIKVRSALRYQSDVTLMSTEFSPACEMEKCQQIQADFYRMTIDEMSDWDLIYLAIPWPESTEQQAFIASWAAAAIAMGKLVCVSCRPALGNVVNPCSRQIADYTLTLSGADMRPKTTRQLTERLAQQFTAMLKDNVK